MTFIGRSLGTKQFSNELFMIIHPSSQFDAQAIAEYECLFIGQWWPSLHLLR